jgi:hypothetical protein
LACSTYGERGGAYRDLVVKPEEERDHLKYLSLVGRIILKWIFSKLHGRMGCIYVS